MFNIAINTFKELTRNKILYLILFFAAVLILFSLALASLSQWQTEKIIFDFFLTALICFLIAVLIASVRYSVKKEIGFFYIFKIVILIRPAITENYFFIYVPKVPRPSSRPYPGRSVRQAVGNRQRPER